MKRYHFLFVAASVIPILVLAGCSGKKENKATDKKPRAVAVNVFVVTPERLDVDLTATGTVLANEEVDLHPEVSGKVTSINFREGQFVNKGQLLVKINDEDLEAQLQKVHFNIELARTDESRKKQLLEARGISREEYDIALNNLNVLLAEEQLVKSQIRKTEIVAPFPGKIGLRNISEGAFISPSTSVTSLQQTQPVKIEFSVPQNSVSLITPGTRIKFDPENGEPDVAEIYATDARMDPDTRTIRARALYDNRNNRLLPGMFVKVMINQETSKDALTVPSEAIVPVLNGEKVFVLRNGRAFSQPIVSGYRAETRTEIRDGLKAGDTVITTGILMLRDSTRVTLQKITNR